MHADSETNRPGSGTETPNSETNTPVPGTDLPAGVTPAAIEALSLKADDIVVYHAPEPVTADAGHALGLVLHRCFPQNRIVILQPGETIERISPDVLRRLLDAPPLKTAAANEEETPSGKRAGSTDNPGSYPDVPRDEVAASVQALARLIGSHMGSILSAVQRTEQTSERIEAEVSSLKGIIEQVALSDEEEEASPRTLDGDPGSKARPDGQSLG